MFWAELILSIIMVAILAILFSIPKWNNIKNEKVYNIAIIGTAFMVLCQIALLIIYKINGAVYDYVRMITMVIPWLITLIVGIILNYFYKKRNKSQ